MTHFLQIRKFGLAEISSLENQIQEIFKKGLDIHDEIVSASKKLIEVMATLTFPEN